MPKTALLIGASGLVGRQLLDQLLENDHYSEVVALIRRPLDVQHPKLRQEVFDFDNPDAGKVKGDHLYCALGTTIRKAGSQEAQYRIDCTYPAEVGRIARENGCGKYLLVSSLGADAKASNFYLRTKGELEEKIRALNFDCFVSARPSFLLGKREEFRLGEKIGIVLVKLFGPILPLKIRGIQASQVAHALITLANRDLTGVHLVSSDQLHKI